MNRSDRLNAINAKLLGDLIKQLETARKEELGIEPVELGLNPAFSGASPHWRMPPSNNTLKTPGA